MNTRLLGALQLLLFGALWPCTVTALAGQVLEDVRYDVVYNAETALRREIHVEMSFRVTTASPVALSLPSWTPGAYELSDFAKNVRGLWARQDGSEVRWDKSDFDTWRIYPTRPGEITVGFEYLADDLDTGSAWSTSDFTYFNGTNLFLFPDGGDLSFESIVTFHTEADWVVATGLTSLSTSEYTASDYHELVDNPTFVGRFDLDSLQVGPRWYRLATYPEGRMAGPSRATLWDQIRRMMPPMEAVFDAVPWDRYTTLLVFDPEFGGGSALEHANSHLGIYHPTFLGTPVLALITAHEIFHGWNVKRLRPADLWPYDYGRAMPTELLWVSEGITDYYADLALVRGGIVSPEYFYQTTLDKINEVRAAAPVALEDASLSAWIGPRDGTSSIYYPKGSLAGLMLDILVRDATDNRRSLDDVLKALYVGSYGGGRGFTEEEWWEAVRQAADGRSFQAFHDAFIDGREPYPWSEVLPLAGLQLVTDIEYVARMGIMTTGDAAGVTVVDVDEGSTAEVAGVEVGDRIVSVGDVIVQDVNFGAIFRAIYSGRAAGTRYDIVVERDGQRRTLPAELQLAENPSFRIAQDGAAGAKARRIRNGILTGAVEG